MTTTIALKKSGLVLYKNRPAIINQTGEKLTIQLESGKTINVRPKDITPLHPGPLKSLADLHSPPSGDIETAWELLAGETSTLPELAELIFDAFTPASAWATWQLIDNGLYFRGSMDAVEVRLPDEVAQTRATRQTKEAEKKNRAEFLERVRTQKIIPADGQYLTEVEMLAYGQRDKSWVLRETGQTQNRENAHALLLQLSYWDENVNPYPHRMGVSATSADMPLPELPAEQRVDLTHLPAFAIDDEGSTDPDDAISLDGHRLWVHIADVAALVPPNSPTDIEAQARGANLYLPEGTVTMLPPAATPMLALGLQEVSPALSFGLDLADDGSLAGLEIVPSLVKVQRLSYEQAEGQMEQKPFALLHRLTQGFEAARRANGSAELDLPEVRVRVVDGQVVIKPLPRLKSRDMVREAMLATGQAVAQLAVEQQIPLPFNTQEPSSVEETPETMSEMFAYRRTLQRSQLSTVPGPHAGLGLDSYAQATSPLRRYADLLVHQQLRAWLRGDSLLSESEVLERVGAAEAITGSVRQAERLSNKHWTLVYLLQNSGWSGNGIIVEKFGNRAKVVIPDLDLETSLHLRDDLPLDSEILLRVRDVNLPELDAYFRRIE